MDSMLVISYSYTGVSLRAAQLLCSHHGWPLGTIEEDTPRGTLRCVLDALLRRHPRVRYQGPPPEQFRTVILVSPIWMYRLAGPMRSFVHDHRARLQRVAVISTMASGGAVNAVREIAAILGRPPVATAAFTQRELEDGTGTRRLLGFGDAFLSPPSAQRSPAASAGGAGASVQVS